MCDCARAGKGITLGVLLVLLFAFPAIANGEESTATTSEKNSKVQQSTYGDSGVTMSDVMNWIQRFGNRVGENISEAASKTSSAVKNATSDNTPEDQSKGSP
jgi:hypothetical protein